MVSGGLDTGALETRILPMGERALLIETASLEHVLALRARLEASTPAGVLDIVPAARTVLVQLDRNVLSRAAATAWIEAAALAEVAALSEDVDSREFAPTQRSGGVARSHLLDISYDGPDLDEVARLLGMTPDALIAQHLAARWTVAFTGFAPGFGYLVSDEWSLDVPRRESPRTSVPAGSVGVAGQFSGAYPRQTPGGWQLIGTTAAPLFDALAADPALLAPGDTVRFQQRPVRQEREGAQSAELASSAAASSAAATPRARSFRIERAGLLATVQDFGRPGLASRGIAPSGALDRGALRTANRLLGNPEGAAGIELTMGGFAAELLPSGAPGADAWIAITGAAGAVTIDGRAVDQGAAVRWPVGSRLEIDIPTLGVRPYLAVRGGVDAPLVAGSRSSDVMAGLGSAPLAAGDVVGIRDDATLPIPANDLSPWSVPGGDIEVMLGAGPRADWFEASALASLFDEPWLVTNDSNRVGMRLAGPALARARGGELPSEGMVVGAMQVPPSGQPTVLLADGPVTGGYPVIAVVAEASLDRLAQARPGQRVRFRHAQP